MSIKLSDEEMKLIKTKIRQIYRFNRSVTKGHTKSVIDQKLWEEFNKEHPHFDHNKIQIKYHYDNGMCVCTMIRGEEMDDCKCFDFVYVNGEGNQQDCWNL